MVAQATATKGTRTSWFYDCDKTNTQCPFEIQSPVQKEIVTAAQQHFKNVHNMANVPEKDILSAAVARKW